MSSVFQLSNLNAVMLGEFEPAMTLAQLKLKGDLGIDTFRGLGGELILLNGRAWNGTHTGEAVPIADDAGTPFACAVQFTPGRTARLGAFASPLRSCAPRTPTGEAGRLFDALPLEEDLREVTAAAED